MNHNYEPPSFLQRLFQEQTVKFLQKIFLLPPLTVMVFLRRDIGSRLLNPMLSFTLFVIYAYLTHAPMRSPFFAFATISVCLGLFHRIKGWWKHHRGERQHSYYIGDSIFETARTPKFFRKHRIICRFQDPALVVFFGYRLLDRYHAQASGLGWWLVISGVMLFGLEIYVLYHQRERVRDMVDGLVYSEYQGNTVEKFDDQAKDADKYRQSSDGISTGLDADLQQKIKNRRR